MNLCAAPSGKRLMICGINADPALCQRLQELGLCEKACIWKLAGNTSLICQVGGARVAISHLMASQILVRPYDDDSERQRTAVNDNERQRTAGNDSED